MHYRIECITVSIHSSINDGESTIAHHPSTTLAHHVVDGHGIPLANPSVLQILPIQSFVSPVTFRSAQRKSTGRCNKQIKQQQSTSVGVVFGRQSSPIVRNTKNAAKRATLQSSAERHV